MNLLLSTGAIAGIVVGAVALVVLLFVIWWFSTRNKIVRARNQMENAFHDIDIYLKKRFDLIPNLVETVKGYAKHESETFQKVTEARSKVQSAVTPAEKIEANAELTQSLRSFNAVFEKYPELKANTNFMDLQHQLKGIETELSQSRKYFNATVRQFNTYIQTFPACIVAKSMHCEQQPYFELDDPEERKNVKVSF